jgi:hypothetical protein
LGSEPDLIRESNPINDGDMHEKILAALGLVGGPWGLWPI